MTKKRIILVIIFIILTILSLLIGADSDLIKSLFALDPLAITNFIHGRLPRTVVIILAAASLSVAGLIMQALGQNKFISAQTAGISDAAALGVLLSFIIFKIDNIYLRFIFAFIFALLSAFIFMGILSKIKFKNVIYIPLIGLMYGAIIYAGATLLADLFNARAILTALNLGSFAKITLFNSSLLIILIPALVLSFVYAMSFSIVSVGKDFAQNLGVNYKLVTTIGLVIIAIVSASCFIVVGPLPFLGLIIPNLVTLYYGDHLKKSILDVAIFGATFVLLNDIISRLIVYPYEIAVGLTMGISGAIIFLFLILRKVGSHG